MIQAAHKSTLNDKVRTRPGRPIHRRTVTLCMTACLSIVTAGVAACSSNTAGNVAQTSSDKTLTFTFTQDPGELAFDDTGEPTYTYTRLLYDGLFRITPKTHSLATVEPDAAQSWTISANAQVFTFHLRHGIRFSNGEPLTAADVKFSLQTDMRSQFSISAFLTPIKSITTPNPYTVILTLKYPDRSFWPILAEQSDIYPENVVQREGIQGFEHHPVGSGPYELVSWKINQYVIYKRNPYYWGPRPAFQRIVINISENESDRVDQLLAGQTEATPIDVTSLAQIEGSSALKVVAGVANTVQYVGLRTDQAPTNNIDVRQAMNYAINRTALITTLVKGKALEDASVLWPNSPYATTYKPYPYDPAKARQLLKAYGKPVNIKFDYMTDQADTTLAQALAGYWTAVGIHVQLVPLNPAIFFARQSGGILSGGKIDQAFLTTWTGATDPDEVYANTVAASGFLSFTNIPAVNTDVAKATTTGNQAVEGTALHAADNTCYTEACWVFLWYPLPLYGESKSVTVLSTTEGVVQLGLATSAP